MTTGWLIFLLGVLVGSGTGIITGRRWGYRDGHLDGYQDHRAEAIDRANKADERKIPGTELQVRSKTSPRRNPARDPYPFKFPPNPGPTPGTRLVLDAPWGSLPGGGRPLPPRPRKTWTDAASIAPVAVPRPPQAAPAKAGADETATLTRLTTTGELRAATDNLIARIRAGTWP